jgi:hypothetical protein
LSFPQARKFWENIYINKGEDAAKIAETAKIGEPMEKTTAKIAETGERASSLKICLHFNIHEPRV